MEYQYYIVKLTNDQVASGILNKISDVISNDFFTSGEDAMEGRLGKQPQMFISDIKFDNTAVNPDFYDQYGSEVANVLYINEVAKKIIDKSNLSIEITKKINHQLPERLGTMISMAHWE